MSNGQRITIGGYGPFEKIDAKTKKIFDEAMQHFVGAEYVPLIVATQVVSGTNYLYICNATGVYPGATTSPAEVVIYQPLTGAVHITSINSLP